MADLELMHQNGYYNYGIMTSIADETGDILVVQHPTTPKMPVHGAWGILGETAKVHLSSDGEWLLESTVQTVLRGMVEELDVSVKAEDIWVPRDPQYVMTRFPVVHNCPQQAGVALSHVVRINNELKDEILASPATDEVIAKKFINPEDLDSLPLIRPGTQQIVAAMTQLRLSHEARGDDYVQPLAPEDSQPNLETFSQDAVLPIMFSRQAA